MGTTTDRYTDYSVEMLLDDSFFLESHRRPTPESRAFWEAQRQTDPALGRRIDTACRLLELIGRQAPPIGREETVRLWERIEAVNRRTDRNRRIGHWSMAAAACLSALLIAGSFFRTTHSGEKTDLLSFVTSAPVPENRSAGIQLVLTEKQTVEVPGKRAELSYRSNGQVQVNSRTVETAKKTSDRRLPAFNQLLVPSGRTSCVTFSDSTRIWVNSGSRLVYPVEFSGNKREIYVEGEIYLEVARHEGQPFVVHTDRMEIEVLGTSFNVHAYRGDETQSVVLVSGKVAVQTGADNRRTLAPEQMFTCNGAGVRIEKVDVYEHIAWKDGYYRYRSQPLGTVIRHIARYYDRHIEYDPALDRLNCSGKLDLKEDFEAVLKALENVAPLTVRKNGENVYIDAQQPDKTAPAE